MKYELTNYFEFWERETLIEMLTLTPSGSFIIDYSNELRLRLQLLHDHCHKDVNFHTSAKILNEFITANKK